MYLDLGREGLRAWHSLRALRAHCILRPLNEIRPYFYQSKNI